MNNVADRVRLNSKSSSIIKPMFAVAQANQNINPSDQVVSVLMLAALYCEELGLNPAHELSKASRALADQDSLDYAHEVHALRGYVQRHLAR